MYFLSYNNRPCTDLNVYVKTRPVIPAPERQIDDIPIQGGETLYQDYEEYNDINITVPFNFIDRNNVQGKFRELKCWLYGQNDNKLYLSNDMNYFYKVNKVKVGELTTIYKVKGDFNAVFTCSPYLYSTDGQEKISLPSELYNYSWLYSKPIFILEGEGLITLIINGNSIKLNIGQSIIVDTEKELIFREGNIENQRKTGKWSDLYLMPGKNTLSYILADGSTLNSIKLIPNWREL